MYGRTLYFNWEVNLMEWLQSHVGHGAALAKFFSYFGEEVIIIMIFGLIYWCIDKKAAKSIGTSLVIGIMLNPLLKNIVLRRRPYFDHENIECMKPVNKKADPYDITFQGYSFPSAHSLNATVMYTSLWRVWKKPLFLITAVLLPILVAVSRVVLGNHYPTDVLFGLAAGTAVSFLIPEVQKKVNNENLFRLVVFLISLAGLFYCRTDDYFTALGIMAGFFAAIPFEEKFVCFSETKNPLIAAIRVLGGGVTYFILNTLLKLPFSEEFLTSGALAAHMVRCIRYAIIVFAAFAIYPMLFLKPSPLGKVARRAG